MAAGDKGGEALSESCAECSSWVCRGLSEWTADMRLLLCVAVQYNDGRFDVSCA